MYRWRPGRWAQLSIVGVGLPFLAAGWLNNDQVQGDLATRTAAAIANLGANWATVDLDLRDATIRGDSPSDQALDDAVKAVAGTYGVRTVNSVARVVPPVALMAPTIESLSVNSALPEIKGTWPEGVAKTLTVKLADMAFELGKAPELTSQTGNWLLKVSKPLADGTYDVTAEVSDGGTNVQASAQPGKLVVDTVSPAPAAIDAPAADAKWPYAITGNWPEGDGNSLAARLVDKVYKLGTDADLTSDGAGKFSFAPKAELAPGTYDVDVIVTDPVGNSAIQTAKGAIVVAAGETPPAPPPPTPPAAPVINLVESGAKWPYPIIGTWAEGNGNTLAAKLLDKVYALGAGSDLTSDGKGTFTFAPAVDLQPGTYDVDFTVSDAAGQSATTTAKGAIVVAEPEPAPPPQPDPAPAATLTAPVVGKALSLSNMPEVKGTFAEGIAKSLVIGLGGASYALGTDAPLTTDGAGNWTLKSTKALADGIYDVTADVSDGAGATLRDETVAEIEVDAVPPAAPVVTAVEAAESPASIAGTWSEGDSTALTVSLPAANITAKLGEAGSALTSDGGGNWTLALAQKLAPGAYDVVAESTDKHGRVSSAMAAGAIVVKQPAPPPRDCAADLASISMETPLRFRFKRTILQPPYDTALGPYVALLNDPDCASEKVEIMGHADYLGSTRFNQYLSELRANYVLDALVKAGIDGARLSVKGFSENMPLVPAKTKEAREKNRRVEFTLVK